MFSISSPEQLRPGDVLHHPSAGFARVHRIDDGNISVAWQPRAGSDQRITRARDIQSGFRLCAPGGFMYLSVVDLPRLSALAEERSNYLISLLLDDLAAPQSPIDIREWILSRNVLSPRAFQDWWKEVEPTLGTQHAFRWDGKRLSSKQEEQLQSLKAQNRDQLSQAFQDLRPVARFRFFNRVDKAVRNELMAGAIQSPDREAILLLLRDSEITDDADGSVLALAMDDDADLAATLLLRRHEGAEMAFARFAASREHRPFLKQIFKQVPGGYQASVVLSLMDQALSGEGGELAVLFLAETLPGGPSQVLRALELGTLHALNDGPPISPQVLAWLEHRSAESTMDQPIPAKAPLLDHLSPLPPEDLLPLSTELARALAQRHCNGDTGGVVGARRHEDGSVELGPAEEGSRSNDVRMTFRRIAELAIGRLPKDAEIADKELLAFLSTLVESPNPEWMAVATRAMSEELQYQPQDCLDLWEQLEQASATAKVRRLAPQRPHLKLEVAHDTHIGLLKSRMGQTNQDAVFWQTEGPMSLLIVADGISVSTAGSGNLASAILVQVIASRWETEVERLAEASEPEIHSFLDQALAEANQAICESSLRMAGGDLTRHIPMGTTAVVAIVRGDRAHIVSLGDSRAYLVGATGAALLTADQNLRGEWLRSWQNNQPFDLLNEGYALVGYAGHFDEEGQPSPVPALHRKLTVLPGESLVLCSDGLTDYASSSPAEMARLIEAAVLEPDLGVACRSLVEKANAGGGGDNVTVLIARPLPY